MVQNCLSQLRLSPNASYSSCRRWPARAATTAAAPTSRRGRGCRRACTPRCRTACAGCTSTRRARRRRRRGRARASARAAGPGWTRDSPSTAAGAAAAPSCTCRTCCTCCTILLHFLHLLHLPHLPHPPHLPQFRWCSGGAAPDAPHHLAAPCSPRTTPPHLIPAHLSPPHPTVRTHLTRRAPDVPPQPPAVGGRCAALARGRNERLI